MLLLSRWSDDQSRRRTVETGGREEVVLRVCELVLPEEQLWASFIIRGGRKNRPRCVAYDDLNAGGRHVVQRGRRVASL